MIDNEIKTLERHLEINNGFAKHEALKALGIINRLQAEIERLNNDLRVWKDIAHRETGYVGIAKAEAIKEFVHEIFSPFKDKAYLNKRDLEIIVNNLAKYYE